MATTKTALQAFLDQAYYWAVTNVAKESGGQNKFAKGSELAKIFSLAGASAGTAWCAIFVYACAKKAGVAGKLMTRKTYAPSICHSVVSKGGKWIKGPYETHTKVKPQPGDLILYNSSSCHMKYKSDGSVKEWHGYHVGIVYKVTSTTVVTMEGNVSGGRAKKITHTLGSRCIGGYARPNWSSASNVTVSGSGSSGSSGGGSATGPLYKTENDRHDMTMREIGYMDDKGKLTKTNTGIQISLINYTTSLGDLYDMFAQNTYGGTIYNLDKLKGNEKTVVKYLIDQGLNAGAACGMAGNIKMDSNYNASTVSNMGYGICRWTGMTAGQMRSSIGEFQWATSLSGQLDFLMGDLMENYEGLLADLNKVEVSASGAKKAAELFAKTYRKITDATARVKAAQSIFNTILITAPKQQGKASNPQTVNKTCKVIDVSKKPQNVLSNCWRKFEVGMCDTAILNEWKSKGKPTSKGLAFMDKCYLVSFNTSLALNVNNYIELVTDYAGTIPCIVAGGYNDDKVSCIRFYRDMDSAVDLREFNTAKIKQIKNFGKRTKN